MAKVTDEYRVQAVNTSRDTQNKVHDDTVAARYGFRGGLVAGVNVYGYMAVPVLARLGRAWLESLLGEIAEQAKHKRNHGLHGLRG